MEIYSKRKNGVIILYISGDLNIDSSDLIEVVGRRDTAGKPMLYGTTMEFLRYFGLKDIKDLPGADELASMFDGTEIEEQSPEQLSFDTDQETGDEAH